jgi:hypothetical protein
MYMAIHREMSGEYSPYSPQTARSFSAYFAVNVLVNLRKSSPAVSRLTAMGQTSPTGDAIDG